MSGSFTGGRPVQASLEERAGTIIHVFRIMLMTKENSLENL